jgi:hypothetical protein
VPILATSSIFSTGHIALTGLISGALAAAVALFWNDWLAPTVTWVVLGIYGALRSPIEPRRYEQSRLGATVIAFAVNVMTI